MDPDSYLCRLADLFDGVTVTAPTMGAIIAILLAVLLLYASGFVSASEIAFFSLSPVDLSEIEEGKHTSDRRISALLNDSERLLATILISNNFVNVTIIMLCNYFFASTIHFGNSVILEFLLITVVLTFLLLLFGEIMPKIYSAQNTLKFCRKAAPVISFLKKFFSPLSALLVRSSFLVNRCVAKRNYNISVDELSQALELTDKSEISEESNILEGIIRFGEETAKEVMTSRLDMVDLEINTPYSEVLKCIVENAYSRIPVYAESRDNIKGILYIKDLLPHLGKGDNFRWQTLVRPAYFVPETKMIDDLLRDFQANKIHIAIVVDEFGGTSGIVTMEDLLEEIVGEIWDEDEEIEHNYYKIGKGEFLVNGDMELEDMLGLFDMDEDSLECDSVTVGGYILEHAGTIPHKRDNIEADGFKFTVMEVKDQRILRVVVKKNDTSEENESDEKSENKKSE